MPSNFADLRIVQQKLHHSDKTQSVIFDRAASRFKGLGVFKNSTVDLYQHIEQCANNTLSLSIQIIVMSKKIIPQASEPTFSGLS